MQDERGAIVQTVRGRVIQVNERGFRLAEYRNRWFNPSVYAQNIQLPSVGDEVEAGLDSREFLREVAVLRRAATPSLLMEQLALDDLKERIRLHSRGDIRGVHQFQIPQGRNGNGHGGGVVDGIKLVEPTEPVVSTWLRAQVITASAQFCSQIDELDEADVIRIAERWERWCLGIEE